MKLSIDFAPTRDKRQYSAPRTPQQNGVVERKNRTLIEAARSMLSTSRLPIYFWTEAVNTACYTQNRTLINKEHMKTPYERMNEKKPTVKYFHVFELNALCLRLEMNIVAILNPKHLKQFFCWLVSSSI